MVEWVRIIFSWPLVALFVVLLYRKELKSLLSNVSGIAERARKEKVKIEIGNKFKIIFGETIKKIEEEVNRLKPVGTPGVDIPMPAGDGQLVIVKEPTRAIRPTPLPPNYYREHLYRLVDILPRAAILEAWREVELAVEEVATLSEIRVTKTIEEVRSAEPPDDHVSPPVLTRYLVERQVIDIDTFTIFEELRQLRNQASHVPDFQPLPENAKEYVDIALRLVDRLHSCLRRTLSNSGTNEKDEKH